MATIKNAAAKMAAKVAKRISTFVLVFVKSIYGDTSPFARVGDAKIFHCRGFKICIMGYTVYIQVDDPQRKAAAIRYAKNIVKSRCKHHFDDESYLRKLENADGYEYMRSLYGSGCVDDLNAEKEKSYKTDIPGVFVEDAFRPFNELEEIGA